MGQGEPEHAAGHDERLSPVLARLAGWEDAGAQWRVAELTGGHARVDLCACTGERVDVLETDDPAALALFRERRQSAEE